MRIGKSLLIGILSAVGLASSHATAAVIVLDNFTNTGVAGARPIGTVLDGTQPADVNLPGNNWQVSWGNISNWGQPTLQTFGGTTNAARISTDLGLGTSIASAGPYIKPTQMSAATSFDVTNVGNAGGNHWGAGLGFYSATAVNVHGFTNFRGLAVNPDTGALSLLSNPALFGSSVQTLAYNGTWVKAAVYHTLSYDVNTTGGTLSNVVLDGQSYSFNATNIFTDTNTAFFGIYTSSSAGGGLGHFDFAQLSGVIPEPTSLAVLAVGGLGLIARRRRA